MFSDLRIVKSHISVSILFVNAVRFDAELLLCGALILTRHCRFALWKPQFHLHCHFFFVYYIHYYYHSMTYTLLRFYLLEVSHLYVLNSSSSLVGPRKRKRAIYLTDEWTQIQNQNICRHANPWAGKMYKSDLEKVLFSESYRTLQLSKGSRLRAALNNFILHFQWFHYISRYFFPVRYFVHSSSTHSLSCREQQ